MKNFFKILTPNKIILVVIGLSLSFAGMSWASLKSCPQDQNSQSVVQDTPKDKLGYPPNGSLAEILYDQVPPYFKDLDPQPEQKDVPRNSAIKFTVCDTLVDDISKSGVDTTIIYITIESRLWGVQKVRPDTIVILDPELYFVSCVYYPHNLFDWSDTVVVSLEASDLSTRAGHNHGDTTYTFYTVRDTIAPELTPIYPLPDMIGVPIDSPIKIHGTDAGRGVDLKDVKLLINDSPVTPDTIIGDSLNFEITYIPDSGWLYNDSIHVICEIYDLDRNTAILNYWFKTPTPPLPPRLVLPENGADGLDMTVETMWHKSVGAETYGLQVSLDSLFSNLVIDSTGIEGTALNVSGLSWDTKYYWRANASNEYGTSGWSEVWHFSTRDGVIPGYPPLPPRLVSPENGADNIATTVSLVWYESEGATSYSLQVAWDSVFTDINLVVNKKGLADTLQRVSELSEGMTYYWRANASNEYGTSGWSEVWHFMTKEDGQPPLPPQLVSPEDGANNLDIPVTTVWHKSTGANTYGLQVSIDSLFAITSLVINKTGLADTFEVVEELSKGMTYYWRANASNEYGTSDWSEVWHFKTKKDSLPPLPPELVSPPNRAEDQDTSLTLVWHESEGATSYGLQVAVDSLFTDANLVVNKIGLADTLQEVSELSEGMTYYWRAHASNEYRTSDWSEVWHFRTRERVVLSDLFILNFISSAGENEIDENTPVSLEAYIICVNNSCSDSFAVSFYLDGSDLPFALFWINGLYDGEVRLFNPSIQIGSTGVHKVIVFVDCHNNVFEENEENNMAEVTIEVRIKDPKLIVRSNPFTPNDDGFNDDAEFNFEQFDVENPNLKIFDMHGKKVIEFDIPNNKRFIWNGSDSNRTPLLPGIYLYIFSDRDKAIARGCIVIAR